MIRAFILTICVLVLPWHSARAEIQEIKTPAGFTIWLMEDHSLPLIAAYMVFRGSGLAYDPSGKEGRGNMAAALLMEGAGDMDDAAFNAALEEYAIRMNVGVDDDTLQATLQTLTTNKSKAFAMLADILIRPRFDGEAIDRTRRKIETILHEQATSPYYKLSRAWQEMNYPGHPYGRLGLGDAATLKELEREDFQHYTTRYLTKENIIISVVGDVNKEEITRLVDEHFSAMPDHYQPDSKVVDTVFPSVADTIFISHDMPQTLIKVGLPGIARSDPDFIAAYILNHIIGGSGLGSRLADAIRIKRGLTYSISTGLNPKTHANEWIGMFSTRSGKAEEAVEVFKNILQEVAEHGVTAEELADAKSFLTSSYILNLSSNEEIASYLSMIQFHHLGMGYLKTRNDLMNAVALEDIRRVSQRLILPAHLRMVMVGKSL